MSIETPEYAQMLKRMVRAYGRRVADADDVDLGEMRDIAQALDEAVVTAVAGQVARGASWTDIGRGLDITRQAARQRFAHRMPTDSPSGVTSLHLLR